MQPLYSTPRLRNGAIDQYNRNGVVQSITDIVKNLNAAKLDDSAEVVISPPALYLTLTRELANPKIGVAAQNVFDKPNGAFTGEISVEQLKDTKVNWALVGHSERRVILKESDEVCLPEPDTAQTNATVEYGANVYTSSLPARSRLPLRVAFRSSSALVKPWRYVICSRLPVFRPGVGHRDVTWMKNLRLHPTSLVII